MREIKVEEIEKKIEEACLQLVCNYPDDVFNALKKGYENEVLPSSKKVLSVLIKNASLAKEKHVPVCQDTGMVSAYVTLGQNVKITGNLKQAINNGVSKGYTKYSLRKSIVKDPLFNRINTGDNTPVLIFVDVVEGDIFNISLSAKGFGSENTSRIKMMKPSDGAEGVKAFVLECVKLAGPNACPPMVIGVGIGGSFDYAPYLAKKALLRDFDVINEDENYRLLEEEILTLINESNIGPMGLKGKTTALKVMIETFPTHIAGLPCAVSICCHISRHIKLEF